MRPLDERMLRHHGGSAAQPATTAKGVHVKASTGSAAAETPTTQVTRRPSVATCSQPSR